MKKLLIIFLALAALLLREECHGQGTVKYTAGISYGVGAPTYTPQGNVSKKYINLTTLRSHTYSGASWVIDAQGVDVISGCSAPAYTPGIGQSTIAINNCTVLQNGQGPELYVFDGASWIFINEKNTAPTYTAGTGIDITGTVISNTGDLSNTNEIQNLSLSGQTLGISSGNTVALPVVAVAAGTGISVSNSSGTATVTNTAPDQVVSIIGAGINAVTGTYPNFTVTGTEVDGSTTNELQTLSVAGSNLSISGGNTVTLPTPSSTLDALTDVTITPPANNQILQYNAATTQWVNATLSAITGSGQANRLAFFTSSGALSSESTFVVDSVNNRFGIGVTPLAKIHILGSDATSSGYYLQANNSAGTKILRGNNLGELEIGNYSNVGGKLTPSTISSIASLTTSSGVIRFDIDRTHTTSGLAAISMSSGFGISDGTLFNSSSSINPTGTNTMSHTVLGVSNMISGATTGDIFGTTTLLGTNGGLNVAPTGRQVNLRVSTRDSEVNTASTWRGTGSATYTGVLMDPNINQQAGATGAITGINYSPVATSILGRHYAALFQSGQVAIGTETPSIAASLEVTSTTQGVLFPRMTATQRDAIASPPDGLVVYNTTAAKLQVRAASAWVDLH